MGDDVDATYDVTVIGSGPGGYVAAVRAAQLGLRTALVEKSPALGGTCLHRGCIPTKELLRTAEVLQEIRGAKRRGIEVGTVTLDIAAVQKRKTQVVDKLAKGIDYLMKKNKVDVLRGHGRLAGGGRVVVAGDGGAREIATKHVVLATGSTPRLLPGVVPDGARIITSDEALALPSAPARLAILGAGAIGVEFATIYLAFGSRVILVEMLPRILPLEDEEISAELARSLRKRGVEIHAGTRVETVTAGPGSVTIAAAGPDGARVEIEADVLLVAVGRRAAVEGIGLETTKVRVEKGCVVVNEHLETDEPGIYAIGDLLDTPLLAHVASAEGIHAVERIAGKNPPRLRYDAMPGATYCDPEVASVGLTEAEARRRGHEVAVGKFPFSAISKAAVLGVTEGIVKIVADAAYDEILGVHIIGPHATELIAEACVALRLEATAADLMYTVHPHPTLSEALKEAAHDVHGEAIHF